MNPKRVRQIATTDHRRTSRSDHSPPHKTNYSDEAPLLREAVVPSQQPTILAYDIPGTRLEVRNISHWYTTSSPSESEDDLMVLNDVSLTVKPGEFVSLLGPSGCGKTTLLNMLACLEGPSYGTITIDGREPQPGDPRIAYIFARDALLPWRTARDNAALGLELIGVEVKERRARAEEALSQLGLGEFMDSYPAELSQGMRQRVALARALSMDISLLLLDEPFSALDAQTRIVAQDRFLELWERLRCTVVLVTHDLAEAVALSDRVIVFTGRPATVKSQQTVDLPRPRVVRQLQNRPDYHAIYDTVWTDLEDVLSSGTIEE